MPRFLHSVDRIFIIDGDDVRRAPMVAALLQEYVNKDPVFRLWQTKVESAGTSETTVGNAPPVFKAQQAMHDKKEMEILSHQAKKISSVDIEKASLILAIEKKHADAAKNICSYPSQRDKVVKLYDYLGQPGKEFPALIGSTQSEYKQFLDKVIPSVPSIGAKLLQDTFMPMLVRGKGLGSGLAVGKARIIQNMNQANEVEKGDIVVCSSNDIAGVYGRGARAAGGIVTDKTEGLSGLSEIGSTTTRPGSTSTVLRCFS